MSKISLENKVVVDELRLIAGVDLAYWKKDNKEYACCCIVVLDFIDFSVREKKYVVGVQFTGNMDSNTLYYGYKANHKKGYLTEALLHPTENIDKKNNYIEFTSLLDEELLEKLKNNL